MAYAPGALPLPFELNREIALSLPLKDLASFCRTSQALAQLCRSKLFWRQKWNRDFPDLPFEQNILRQGATYYTVNGINYRALYLLAEMLLPAIKRGRKQLERLLALNPIRDSDEVRFLGPIFPYFLEGESVDAGGYIKANGGLMIEKNHPDNTQATVPWKLFYQDSLVPASPDEIDAGLPAPRVYLPSNNTIAIESGVGNMQEAANFFLTRGYVPYDHKTFFTFEQLLINYNYFVFESEYMRSSSVMDYDRAVASLPRSLRFPGQKNPKLIQDGFRAATAAELDLFFTELETFLFGTTQVMEQSRLDLSLWRDLIKRDFPALDYSSSGTDRDHRLYNLLRKLKVDNQEPLQKFLAKFRQIMTQAVREPQTASTSQTKQPKSSVIWLVRSSLPLNVNMNSSEFFHLADKIKLKFFVKTVPAPYPSYQYKIELEKNGDRMENNFPFLPENDPQQLLEWLDDLERDYMCFVPYPIPFDDIVDVSHLVSDNDLPLRVHPLSEDINWIAGRNRRGQ